MKYLIFISIVFSGCHIHYHYPKQPELTSKYFVPKSVYSSSCGIDGCLVYHYNSNSYDTIK